MVFAERIHSNRFIYRFFCFGTAIILVLCVLLSRNEMKIELIDIEGLRYVTVGNGIIVNIDYGHYWEDRFEGQVLSIQGWVAMPDKVSNPVSYWIVLKNQNTGKCYQLPTAIISRPDVTEFINDGLDHDNSGFSCEISSNMFDFSKDDYEILVLYSVADDVYVLDSGHIMVPKEDE